MPSTTKTQPTKPKTAQKKRALAKANAKPAATKRATAKGAATATEAIAWLERHAKKATRDGMARYGIPSDHALGVTMAEIKQLAKQLGRDHALALALWDSGIYEARLLTALVGEPELVTPVQMERFCRDFDNWAVCDTLCFHLFDRTPHALQKIEAWSERREEFVKRAAFALLASLALHDRKLDDAPFLGCLPLIERAAGDARNFVRKSVSWALRSVGGRSVALHEATLGLARKLAASPDATARSIGKEGLRDLARPALTRRLAASGRRKS